MWARALEGAAGVYHHRETKHHHLLKRRKGRQSKRRGVMVPTWAKIVTRKRSDRSEAQARLLAFLFTHCDLQTLEVGNFEGGKFVGFFDLPSLSRATGLTPSRLDRAISDLRAAEYLYCHQPRELAGDQYKGKEARRKLTIRAFTECTVSLEMLQHYRGKSAAAEEKVRERKAPRRPQSEPSSAGVILGAAMGVAFQDVPKMPTVRPDDFERFRRLEWQVGREHPTWELDQVRAEAHRRLYPDGPPGRR